MLDLQLIRDRLDAAITDAKPPRTIGYRSQGEAEADAAKLSGWSYVRVLQLMELGEPYLDSEGHECWYITATDPITGRTAEWTSPTQNQPRFVH